MKPPSTSWSHWQYILWPLCRCRRLSRAGSRAVPSSANFCELTFPLSSIPSAQHQILLLLSGHVLGWPKSPFRLFHTIIWKNLNNIFDRPSTFKISTSSPEPLLSTAAFFETYCLGKKKDYSKIMLFIDNAPGNLRTLMEIYSKICVALCLLTQHPF